MESEAQAYGLGAAGGEAPVPAGEPTQGSDPATEKEWLILVAGGEPVVKCAATQTQSSKCWSPSAHLSCYCLVGDSKLGGVEDGE